MEPWVPSPTLKKLKVSFEKESHNKVVEQTVLSA
jgi:hypothetical protein